MVNVDKEEARAGGRPSTSSHTSLHRKSVLSTQPTDALPMRDLMSAKLPSPCVVNRAAPYSSCSSSKRGCGTMHTGCYAGHPHSPTET